jgi:hypothetical protein
MEGSHGQNVSAAQCGVEGEGRWGSLHGPKDGEGVGGAVSASPHLNQPMEGAGAMGGQNSLCHRPEEGHPRG